MRITVEVDVDTLKEIQKETGQPKKSPAISQALQSYLRSLRKTELLQCVRDGRTDYGCTNEELEASTRHDAD